MVRISRPSTRLSSSTTPSTEDFTAGGTTTTTSFAEHPTGSHGSCDCCLISHDGWCKHILDMASGDSG
jgi:hypothetical protein